MRRIATLLVAATVVLPVTGAGPARAAADICTYAAPGPVRPGDSGPVVAQLQCYLNHALDPAHYPPLPVDGQYGAATRQRVLVFQGCAGIVADGIVGPLTWSQLRFWANSPTYVC
jgi:lysozyme